eukprot:4246686-Prymnesium_polylepis.1
MRRHLTPKQPSARALADCPQRRRRAPCNQRASPHHHHHHQVGHPPRHASEQTHGDALPCLTGRVGCSQPNSEESPRALRQKVPLLTGRSPRWREHGDGFGLRLPAPRIRPQGTVMRVGGLAPPNRTGLTPAVSHTRCPDLGA